MPASDFYRHTLSHWVKTNRIFANALLAALYACFAQYGYIPPPQNTERIAIIALTANASTHDRQVCLDAGMANYLRKPCSIKDFKQMLELYSKPQTSPSDQLLD